MTDLRKAAEQALEALEDVWGFLPAKKAWPQVQVDEAITALRQALEQPDEVLAEREACAKVCLEGTDMPIQKDTLKIIKAERKRIVTAIRARGEK